MPHRNKFILHVRSIFFQQLKKRKMHLAVYLDISKQLISLSGLIFLCNHVWGWTYLFWSALFRPRVPVRVRDEGVFTRYAYTTVYHPCTQCFPLNVGRECPSPEFREHLIEPTGRKRRKQTPTALFFSPLLGFHTGGSNCRLMCISAVQRLMLLSPIPPTSILML